MVRLIPAMERAVRYLVLDEANQLGIEGRSRMNKAQLQRAVARKKSSYAWTTSRDRVRARAVATRADGSARRYGVRFARTE
jgi:hypothetical protein